MDSFDTCTWVDFVVETTSLGIPTMLISITLALGNNGHIIKS
jgi:hypothetical protein